MLQGYICQLLNHFYGYRVLGIESKLQNVETAKKRQQKYFPNSLSYVKYVCSNVTIDSSKNLESIIQQEFKNSNEICLVGLHACGDLSIFISQIYLQMSIARLLVLVSCCYHKLSLKNLKEKKIGTNEKEYFNYFPLSNILKSAFQELNIDVGKLFTRPFMRLACQETSDRWFAMNEVMHYEHSFYVLARAVLELYGDLSKY